MKSIGIRVSPNFIFYCIAEDKGNNYEILDVNRITVPKGIDIPAKLSFIRTQMLSILNEYKIEYAGIRVTEKNAKSLSIDRLYIEGVILELLSNCNIKNYFTGTIVKIASLLKVESKMIKKYINNEEIFMEIDNWENFAKENKESIIVAIAAIQMV